MNLNRSLAEMMADEVDVGSEDEVLRAKIVTMVVLFAVSMLFGSLPMLISLKFDWFTKGSDDPNLRSSNQLVMGLLAFGGGVLFATIFMHLLPEVDENIRILQESGQMPEMDLYLAALIMCGGFFMMYLVEELVHVYINSRENKSANTSFSRTLSIRRSSRRGEGCSTDVPKLKEVEARQPNNGNHSHSSALVAPPGSQEDPVIAAMRGLLIVLALSIHELFEGLAVGLESSAGKVWYMFGAVSAHKYIIAFCIGVELLAAKTRTWLSVLYVFTFSFVSALGIGVGILLVGGSGATEAGLYSVVLQAGVRHPGVRGVLRGVETGPQRTPAVPLLRARLRADGRLGGADWTLTRDYGVKTFIILSLWYGVYHRVLIYFICLRCVPTIKVQ